MAKQENELMYRRAKVLDKIGQKATERYKENLRMTGYKGARFYRAFHYYVDPETNDIYFELGTNDPELNRILKYLEYGTGLFGTKRKAIQSQKISPRTGKQLLLRWMDKDTGEWVYRRWTAGIKPGFMFTKAVASVKHELEAIKRRM